MVGGGLCLDFGSTVGNRFDVNMKGESGGQVVREVNLVVKIGKTVLLLKGGNGPVRRYEVHVSVVGVISHPTVYILRIVIHAGVEGDRKSGDAKNILFFAPHLL
jgi:hypothetical protein